MFWKLTVYTSFVLLHKCTHNYICGMFCYYIFLYSDNCTGHLMQCIDPTQWRCVIVQLFINQSSLSWQKPATNSCSFINAHQNSANNMKRSDNIRNQKLAGYLSKIHTYVRTKTFLAKNDTCIREELYVHYVKLNNIAI